MAETTTPVNLLFKYGNLSVLNNKDFSITNGTIYFAKDNTNNNNTGYIIYGDPAGTNLIRINGNGYSINSDNVLVFDNDTVKFSNSQAYITGNSSNQLILNDLIISKNNSLTESDYKGQIYILSDLKIKGKIDDVRCIEISRDRNGSTNEDFGYIDFHFNDNDSTLGDDHTSRIIENSAGVLSINGIKIENNYLSSSIDTEPNDTIIGLQSSRDILTLDFLTKKQDSTNKKFSKISAKQSDNNSCSLSFFSWYKPHSNDDGDFIGILPNLTLSKTKTIGKEDQKNYYSMVTSITGDLSVIGGISTFQQIQQLNGTNYNINIGNSTQPIYLKDGYLTPTALHTEEFVLQSNSSIVKTFKSLSNAFIFWGRGNTTTCMGLYYLTSVADSVAILELNDGKTSRTHSNTITQKVDPSDGKLKNTKEVTFTNNSTAARSVTILFLRGGFES